MTKHAKMGAELRGREAVKRFDAVLAEARARGSAVLAVFVDGRFVCWELIPWKD